VLSIPACCGHSDWIFTLHFSHNRSFLQNLNETHTHKHTQHDDLKTYFSLLPFKCPLVTICTASLTFTNFTFCPHSEFMYSIRISEHTAIVSLYSINWLVCITEAESVYCAVRTGYLNVIPVIIVVTNLNNWQLIVLRNDNRSRHMKFWGQSTGHNPLLLLIIIVMRGRRRWWQRRR